MGAVTLEQVRSVAAPSLYPRRVLEGCESALVLFSAAFHGQQDAVWIAEAGLTAECVDSDAVKVAEMVYAYPAGWIHTVADVFEYAARAARLGMRWDVVSLDPPSNLFVRCAFMLPLWCQLARKAVVLGCEGRDLAAVPDGWQETERLRRSHFLGGVYWAVFEPC